MDKAMEKSEDRLDIRLESMNEWRSQMKDQTSTFITKNEVLLSIGSLSARIEELSKAIHELEIDRAKLEGKADQKSLMYTAIASAIGLLLSAISLILKFGG
jgi:uncharacterized protein YhaN